MRKAVYLDYNATTPLAPEVFEAMKPFFCECFGNPASTNHAYGREAFEAVEKARAQVAELIGAKPSEIFFTSGATESNNMAILGIYNHFKNVNPHIITSCVEHKSTLETCCHLSKAGADVTFLKVNSFGQVNPKDLDEAIKDNTKLISLIFANNEIGSLNPINELVEVGKKHDVLFHVDAAQAVGKIPIDVKSLGVDLLSLSGHKIYGPKGIGILYVNSDKEIPIEPIAYGGAQEKGLRPGTLNVPAIIGLGKACELANIEIQEETKRLAHMRDYLVSEVLSLSDDIVLNGHPSDRLCNNVSFSFKALTPSDFSLGLSGLAFSSSSACNSTCESPSHVLKAIGHSDSLANSTIRIGLGRQTTEEDIGLVLSKLSALLKST